MITKLESTIFRKLKSLAMALLPARFAGSLRSWRIRRHLRVYPARTVVHTYGGHKLKIHLTDGLAAGWYDNDWPLLPELNFLRERRLRPGAIVFDLGAHHGIVALMLAREVTASGRVVAVEANSHNAASAVINAQLNGADNLIVRHAAVSDRPGRITFNEGLNGQVDDGT